MQKNFKRVKMACYMVNISMSVVGNLSPLLFLTFRALYGISYSLLGLLVLINFCTQLGIDLIFSFFSHKFNIPKAVKLTPVITVAGLAVYAFSPLIFPGNVYIGLVIGTVLFAVSGGLTEVLISPVIAAIPAENPDREMSKLHSVYAWGVVAVVILSTLFIKVFGGGSWGALALVFAAVPLASFFLFRIRDIPDMPTPERVSGAMQMLKNKGIWACVAAIFLGGAAECTMAQWSSSYLEQALGISKVWGDVFGVAMFALALGLGRSFYAKWGHNIGRVIFLCGVGSTLCYLTAAVSPNPIIGLAACALTGLCASMLWPGNLIVASSRFPSGGVFIYALMAAGGDLGASVGPQLVGLVTDFAIKNPWLVSAAGNMGMLPDRLGMKLGMLVGMLFPLIAIPLYYKQWKAR